MTFKYSFDKNNKYYYVRNKDNKKIASAITVEKLEEKIKADGFISSIYCS